MAIERMVDIQGVRDIGPQAKMDGNIQSKACETQEFEAMFFQSMLKSTCIEQHFIDEPGSLYSSQKEVFHCSLAENGLIEKSTNAVDMPITSPSVALSTDLGNEVNQPVDDFVKSIWPYAQQASKLIGLDPKILVAQAALETGWGKMIAKDAEGSSNNLFNIKAKGYQAEQSITIKTTEYIADIPIKMTASFKKYASVEHSFNDYVSLIKNDHRYKTALSNANDPKRYIDSLQQAGYATDPNYSNKILSIYHGDELRGTLERM